MNYSTIPVDSQLPTVGIAFIPASLYAKLLQLTVQHGQQGRKYELALILTIAVLAKLCEQNQVRDIAQLNNTVLGILASKGHTNVASARRKYSASPSKAVKLLL